MKFSLLIFLLISARCCSQTNSYQQAMLNCDKKTQEINKGNNIISSNLYPDCLSGAKIPDFEAYTIDNHKIDPSYFLGKITVLNFWLKTCPPCIAEIPGLNNIKEKFKDKKVNFLALGKNSEKDSKEFLQIHPWNFDQVKDASTVIDSVFKIKWGYPTTFIIDKRMTIIEICNGGFHDARAAEDIQNRIIPVLERELNK